MDEASGDDDGGSELSDVEDVFAGGEAELPWKAYCVMETSEEEVELHNITHLPRRSWRPHCVRGKAKRRGHCRRRRSQRSGVPTISVDCARLQKRNEM